MPDLDFAADFRTCVKADLWRLNQRRLSKRQLRRRFILLALSNRGFHALLLYRLAHALVRNKIPLLPLVLSRIAQTLFAIDISPHAQLGPGIVIVHGFGLVIGAGARVEGDCCFFHGVTLGDKGTRWTRQDREDGHPHLERGTIVGAGAKLLGPIRVGKSCIIGANAVVLNDVPANSVAAGVPAKVVGRAEQTWFS